jgi:hypothetical protein
MEKSDSPLERAYRMLHGKKPAISGARLARQFLEELDEDTGLPHDLVRECIFYIVHAMTFKDSAECRDIVSYAEELSRKFFPEVAFHDEVHMDDIASAYLRS